MTFIPFLLSAYILCREFFLVVEQAVVIMANCRLALEPYYNKLSDHSGNNRDILVPHGR